MKSIHIIILFYCAIYISLARAENSSNNLEMVGRALSECFDLESRHPGQSILQETESAICFKGRIARGSSQAIIDVLSNKNKLFVINSVGGDGVAAATIGIHILERRISVLAHTLCLSACANYIFLAGHRKYLAKSSILAWHGAPLQAPSFREKILDSNGRLQKTFQMSEQFFHASKINKRLATSPNAEAPGFEAWKAGWDSRQIHFWTWSQKSLEMRFGVKGIKQYWYPTSPEEIVTLGRKYNLELLPDPNLR